MTTARTLRHLAFLAVLSSTSAFAAPCPDTAGPALIDAKRASMAFLGTPQTWHTAVPGEDGCFRHYDGGSVYWNVGASQAFEVHGDIRWLWAVQGWERGHLGYPMTDALTTPDGAGRFNHFQRGSIYWRADLGAHAVINGFRAYWAERGWERNPALGFPINDEMPSFPERNDRYQDFENGVLYYAHASGAIYEMWPFPVASRDKADLETELAAQIDKQLAAAGGEAYRDGAVQITEVTGYRRNGQGRPLNRALKVQAHLKYTAEFLGIDDALPDPSSDLTLMIRLDGRRRFDGDAILYSVLESWSAATKVPFPTSTFISAATINAKLRGELDPQVGIEAEMAVLPSPLSLISVKVTQDGGMNVFVAPL